MRQNRNFGLSSQEPTEEAYDNFNLGKNWDLGFISKEGIKVRREQKKAETDSTRANTAAINKIMSEPTQNQDGGMDAKTALTIAVIVVAGLLVGYGIMNKKRKTKQAAVQKNTSVVNEIV